MTLTTRDSGKCPVPMSIYRALWSLPQRACSVHSKSEGPFLERVSEVTCYRTAVLMFPLSVQPGGRILVVSKGCVGAGWLQPPPLPSCISESLFPIYWVSPNMGLGMGVSGQNTQSNHTQGCPSCLVTDDYNLHSNISKCILPRYPGSV